MCDAQGNQSPLPCSHAKFKSYKASDPNHKTQEICSLFPENNFSTYITTTACINTTRQTRVSSAAQESSDTAKSLWENHVVQGRKFIMRSTGIMMQRTNSSNNKWKTWPFILSHEKRSFIKAAKNIFQTQIIHHAGVYKSWRVEEVFRSFN